MTGVSVEHAADILRSGGIVLVPTDTVVGLVAASPGLERLAEIKGREPNKPVALLCASGEEALALSPEVPLLARKLARRYWPGPLTLVLDRTGGGTVGVRVPDHAVTQALLAAYGGPLYATSANLSGEPAPSALADVDPRIAEAVDLAVEGEPGGGEASAVVDLSGGSVRLLRPAGELTEEELSALVADVRE